MGELKDYRGTRIEFHIIQAFPVTCLNRGEDGEPKTAEIGGVTRARVSSQCWKRAIRLAMHEVSGVELGVRTKLLADLMNTECERLGATPEQAVACGKKFESAFMKKKSGKNDDEAVDDDKEGTDTLMFLAKHEINAIAEEFRRVGFDANAEDLFADYKKKPSTDDTKKKKSESKKKDESKEFIKAVTAFLGDKVKHIETIDGLDIALFGRMIAQATELDVPAAASFNHAISTHKVNNDIDFFTAVADYGQNKGSAHMGNLEFNTATYYRYISLDLGQLFENLGGDRFFKEAITAFIKALYVAVPSARQTTQAGACIWNYAQVLIRKGQGVQMSCDTPVRAGEEGGFVGPSITKLQKDMAKKEKLSGSLFGKIAGFEFGIDQNFNIDDLIDAVVNTAVKA